MMQSQPMLGQVPGPGDRRDAIHIAIVPAVASGALMPGQHVGLLGDVYGVVLAGVTAKDMIGIVDPFLAELVPDGGLFWLCLYPYTITSLRHVWTHPAFKAQVPAAQSKSLLAASQPDVTD